MQINEMQRNKDESAKNVQRKGTKWNEWVQGLNFYGCF